MQASYHLNISELTDEFISTLKNNFIVELWIL